MVGEQTTSRTTPRTQAIITQTTTATSATSTVI